ncbi:MAG: site-specific integrase [Actinomycetota bacterium]
MRPHGRRWRFKWESEWNSHNTLAGALQDLDRLIAQRDRARYEADVNANTVADIVSAWWERKTPELRESTQIRYEGVIRLHIKPKLGVFSADALRALDIEDFYAKVTHKTALVCRDVLRPAFRWGMTNGFVRRVDGNPFDLAKLQRSKCLGGNAEADANRTMEVDEKQIPRRAELEKLLIDAEERADWSWWLYLRLAPSLGGRPSEICALQRKDFDEVTYTISITKASNGATLKITSPKRSASIRSLYVGEDLFDDIWALIKDLSADDYLFGATGQRMGSRVMPCWTAAGATRRLHRAAKRTGIPVYTAHALRHYCATMLLDQGWPPMQVARWLGHKNDTMVRLLYAAHIVEDTRIQMGEAAGRLLRRGTPDRYQGAASFGNMGKCRTFSVQSSSL